MAVSGPEAQPVEPTAIPNVPAPIEPAPAVEAAIEAAVEHKDGKAKGPGMKKYEKLARDKNTRR